ELRLQERHPERFIPHYTMVSFTRIPYSVALARSQVQRGILQRATAALDRLDGVDWAAVDAEVLRLLEPLAAACTARTTSHGSPAPRAPPPRPPCSAAPAPRTRWRWRAARRSAVPGGAPPPGSPAWTAWTGPPSTPRSCACSNRSPRPAPRAPPPSRSPNPC